MTDTKIPKRSAAVVNEIERIRKAAGGRVSAAKVLEAARPKASPLHAYFDWKDGTAAEKWRLHQARNLIMNCELVVSANNEPTIVNAYINLRATREDKRGYHAMSEVVSSASLRKVMIREALEDLKVWENRYKRLAALEPVKKAAEQVRRKHL